MSIARYSLPLVKDSFVQGAWQALYQAICKSEFAFFNRGLSVQSAGLLMPWTALNEIMSQHRLETPRMRLVKQGKEIEPDAYCHIIEHKVERPILRVPVIHKIYSQMDEGATLVVDAIQEAYPPLRKFVQQMERELALVMQANLYLSTRTTRGFETHWDDHDVLIFQIHGRKTWSVFGSTRKHPLYRDFHTSFSPPTQAEWTHTLEPGDVLYLPRGVWHHAVALDEPSLHLTVGVSRPTGITVIDWLKDLLREEEFMRSDAPLFSQPEEWSSYYQRLSQLISERLKQTHIKEFYVHHMAQLLPLPEFGFPFALNKEGPSENEVKESYFAWIPKVFPSIVQEDQDISFESDRRNWVFSKKVLPFFELIKQGNCSFAQVRASLEESIDDSTIVEFLKTLILQGLIHSFVDHPKG